MKRLAYDDIIIDEVYQTKSPSSVAQTLHDALEALEEYEGSGGDEYCVDITITVVSPARATPAGER